MKNRKTTLIIAILLAATLVFSLVSCKSEDKTVWENATYKEDTVLGEGSATFTLEVKALGRSVTFTISTDEVSLADALLKLSLIEGTEGDYGLYLEKVNGMTADFDADQTYWAFYENDAYATSGVDTTKINQEVVYRLVHSK